MTHLAEHIVEGRTARRAPVRRSRALSRPAPVWCRDPRWPALAAALAALRETRRRSVRIVDADCGTGATLLCAARLARALGFTAIEAHGVDDAPALVARARLAATAVRDPAIGISFAAGDLAGELAAEAAFPADIVLWHGGPTGDGPAAKAVAAAGRMLIAAPLVARGAAA